MSDNMNGRRKCILAVGQTGNGKSTFCLQTYHCGLSNYNPNVFPTSDDQWSVTAACKHELIPGMDLCVIDTVGYSDTGVPGPTGRPPISDEDITAAIFKYLWENKLEVVAVIIFLRPPMRRACNVSNSIMRNLVEAFGPSAASHFWYHFADDVPHDLAQRWAATYNGQFSSVLGRPFAVANVISTDLNTSKATYRALAQAFSALRSLDLRWDIKQCQFCGRQYDRRFADSQCHRLVRREHEWTQESHDNERVHTGHLRSVVVDQTHIAFIKISEAREDRWSCCEGQAGSIGCRLRCRSALCGHTLSDTGGGVCYQRCKHCQAATAPGSGSAWRGASTMNARRSSPEATCPSTNRAAGACTVSRWTRAHRPGASINSRIMLPPLPPPPIASSFP